MAPAVSIILLNWNNSDDTIRCIQSLRKLSYPDFSIIVVDNGSEDDSVSRLKDSFPDITLIESPVNKGFTGGNNIGITYALEHKADLVWLLNNDSVVEEDSLSHMVGKLQSDEKLGIAGCTIRYTDEDRTIQAYGGGKVLYPIARHRPCVDRVEDSELNYISGASMLVRREVFEKIGLLDERIFIYWEDVELSHRARDAGFEIGYAPEAVIYHTENASMQEFTERRVFYYNQGLAVFFKSYLWYWPVAVGIYYSVKMVKTLLKGEFAKARAVTRGIWSGVRA